MQQYTMIQWLFFFYFYCFMGWCFESAYVSIKEKRLTNRGFMRGPFLPIYGSGAIMMLLVSMPFQDNLILTYLAGCVGATALEYVTGVLMEALFRVRYWDYSHKKFNFQGHICLESTLTWGFFTILMTRVLHVQIEKIVLLIPYQMLTAMTLVLTALIFADFALSFKAAIDLRDVLIKMEQVKEEMVRIQKRLDAIITLTNVSISEKVSSAKEGIDGLVDGVTNAKDDITHSMSELISTIEGKLARIRNILTNRQDHSLDEKREELVELKTNYTVNLEKHKRLGAIADFFQRSLIRSNPGMTSRRYKEFLEELKNSIRNNKNVEQKNKEKQDQDK